MRFFRIALRPILLGLGYFLLSGFVEAQDISHAKALDSILVQINRIKDPAKRVTEINNVVKGYIDNSPKFDSLLMVALAVCEEQNLPALKWEVLATRGFILLARGDYQGSQMAYLEAAKVAINNSDSTNYFIVQGTIALLNYYLKSYDKAEQLYLQTIRFLEKKPDKKELSSVYNNLGMVYSEQKRYPEAIREYEKSMQLKLELKNPDYLHILNNLADANQKLGNLAKANELFQDFYKQSYSINNPVYMAVANINLGSVLNEAKQSDKALPYLKESLALCRFYGYKTYELEALVELSKCYERLGYFREAYQNSVYARELDDSLMNQERIANMQETEARFEARQKEAQIKSLQMQQLRDNKIIDLQLAVIVLALAGLLLFVMVVIQMRKRNQERNIQNQALKELNENKNRFFSIIAHDLRSPFSALLGLLDILSDQYQDLPPERIKDYLKQLNLSANNTFSLLQNLLMWANSQMEGFITQPQAIMVKGVINQQLEYLHTSMHEKRITVQSNIMDDLIVKTDPEMLSFVVRNLLTNAVKYSPSGGIISITGIPEKERMLISITDQGLGFSPDILTRGLTIGSRKSTPGTHGEMGTGLGLPLCKSFMEKLGGELLLQSSPGKGTTITCVLPV